MGTSLEAKSFPASPFFRNGERILGRRRFCSRRKCFLASEKERPSPTLDLFTTSFFSKRVLYYCGLSSTQHDNGSGNGS
ncbi:hypothetical protein WG66_004195 [Moniliophthora roreri]|nr:hypothetical protein WG66_004195 [Moniliophthora roreri]